MEKLLFSFKTEGFQRPSIFKPKLKEIQKRGIKLSILKVCAHLSKSKKSRTLLQTWLFTMVPHFINESIKEVFN